MTYTIHFKPEIQTLRVYPDNGSYESKTIPTLSATLHYISDNEVYICNLVGNLSRAMIRNVMLKIYKQGYGTIKCERKGEVITYNLKELLRLDKNA